ncbi:MAG TPA: SDR family oxidoreductase [Victivallales bacterium]|nr:SDR family oxidoreductase [Victivallales bacterium]
MEKKELVVITGASSGIGKALAVHFSSKGYNLLLLARRVQLILDLNLPNAICLSLDVRKTKEFIEAIDNGEEKYGPVDCLINNAGIMNFGEFTDDNLSHSNKELIDTNILGCINGIEAVLSKMQKRGKGTILNITSSHDRHPSPCAATYGATKAAIKSLTESLAIESSGKNVRICSIAPSLVDTPIISNLRAKSFDGLKERKVMVDAEEFAEIVYWIYSLPQHICIKDILIAPTNTKIFMGENE